MALTPKTFYGSGEVYSTAYDADTFPTIADVTAITKTEAEALKAFIASVCVEDNQVGYLKNGFSINISTNTLSDKSDLGEMKIDTITEETGVCTFALFNANAETIAMQYPTAAYGSETTTGIGVADVGGLTNMDDTPHVIIFKHKSTSAGDTYAICVGKNMSGFENAWKQDAVTPFTCTFNMQPFDDSGRIYRLVDFPVATA